MQAKSFDLRSRQLGCVPIISRFLDVMRLREELVVVLKNSGYADALIILLKNILINRNALYAVRDWAGQFGLYLGKDIEIGDDRLGRALERLFATDRATLQTRIVLTVVKAFDVKMDQIHGDTTSISFSGSYSGQDKDAVQLKRGHSKDHRPDLKQIVYSLCVSRDGAVPIHFKTYDGNRTDDTLQWETWSSLRTLLQTPQFTFVGDSKLCVRETLLKIDREHGRFVTMVPDTRREVGEFEKEVEAGEVRWERILRKRSPRRESEFDTFDCALGPRQLSEGFPLFWYRTSQKKKRDAEDRKDRISRAWEKLENLDLRRMRGPRTEKAMRNRVDACLRRYHVEKWLKVDIKLDVEEKFRATTRGKPTVETRYRKLVKKVPRLHIQRNAEAIARAQLMDGIFPLTTNTKELPLEVLKIYKYQPKIEKRHATLKSTLEAAPVWLKKNTRIEALMFIEWLAQLTAALIERELRRAMLTQNIKLLTSLPEGRPSETPTFEQVRRLFEGNSRHDLLDNGTPIQSFATELSPVQTQILGLVKVPASAYGA